MTSAFAVLLLKSSDGCVGELLMSSLATAMQANPEAVLAHMPEIQRTVLAVQNFCVPFIAEETSEADVLTVLERSEHALRLVKKPELQKARQTCLDIVARYRDSVTKRNAR